MAKFQKGHKLAKGRGKGNVNVVTKDIREAFKNLVEANIDNMTDWLKRIASTNPERALSLMIEMSEFTIPKLQRQQLDLGNENGLSFEITIKRDADSENKHK